MIYIKTLKEIDYIKRSCVVVARTLDLVKKNAKIGSTTKELDQMAEEFILSMNAKPAFKGYRNGNSVAYPASICSSVNEEVVHGIPGNRVLKNGDILSIDVGVIKNGYFGDAALTVVIGTVKPEYQNLLDVTERSLYLGIEQAIENNRVSDISVAVQSYVEQNGFSIVRELTGHGVGKYLHEEPSIPNFGRKGTGAKLKSGMTIAIEPMVNYGKKEVYFSDDGWTVVTKDRNPSAHFEHTILINNKKPEILTVF